MIETQNDKPNDDEVEGSDIITELSAGDKKLLELTQKLLEPCDRTTYGERQREVAVKLGKSARTVRRLVKKWEEQGLAALQTTQRADKGKYRIDSQWQKFIINTCYNAEPPNNIALNWTREILKILFKMGFPPTRITPSVENGVGISFICEHKYADIECFNEGDILAVISDGKGIPEVWEVESTTLAITSTIDKIREFLQR